MSKTAIVIDSSTYCTKDFVQKNNISVVPLTVNFENVTYTEGVEDLDTVIEIFNRVEEVSKLPTTSQPSASEFLKVFEDLKTQGYERILVFTITSKLSGTFQGAVSASKMFLEENTGVAIELFDSLNVGPAAAIVVQEVVERFNNGQDISNEKINEIVNFYADNVTLFLLVDTLDYLSFGGRISPSIAAIGNLFGIKPVLRIDAGVFSEHAKCRSTKKACLEIQKEFETNLIADGEEYLVFSGHSNAAKELKKLAKVVTSNIDEKVNLTVIDPIVLGPVVSNHVGPGALGIGFTKKYKD